MSYADIMIYAVQLDTWKQRFNAIVEYNKLESISGYKFYIQYGACCLDPPSRFQYITRWYYGYSKERFKEYLDEQISHFFKFLEDVRASDVVNGRTQTARAFLRSLAFFLSELARGFSMCRTAYPDYEELRATLLAYYHGIREWMETVGY
jgi:hypothetical protein